jgi:long-chain fatty acid transport protein
MSLKKHKLALAIAAAAGMTFSAGAMATNGIIQAGNGMVAHGLGGAGLSNAAEAMSGFDNPALISQTGDSLSVGFSVFMPDRTVDNSALGGTPVTSDSKMFSIPQVAYTSAINDKMSWGILVNALGGMNTDYRSDAFGTPGSSAESVNLQGMIIAPTMSYALSKDLSLGASLVIGYETLTVRNLFGSGLNDEGSAMAYGVKLGADWKIADGISIGGMVQPKLSGDEISYFKNFLIGAGFSGDAALVLPNEVGIGGKFAVGKNMDIVADILWYQWSDVDVFEFFGWEDQIVYKAGVEFRTSDKLALRAGFNYGESPIQGGNRTGNGAQDAAFANYPFPAISETHFTIGLGYKMDQNMEFNAYYLYSPEASQTSTTTSFTPAAVPAGTEISMTQNAFGIGINYKSK